MKKKVVKVVCENCKQLYEVSLKESIEMKIRLCPKCRKP